MVVAIGAASVLVFLVARYAGTSTKIALIAVISSLLGASLGLVGGYLLELRREERAERSAWQNRLDLMIWDALTEMEEAATRKLEVSIYLFYQHYVGAARDIQKYLQALAETSRMMIAKGRIPSLDVFNAMVNFNNVTSALAAGHWNGDFDSAEREAMFSHQLLCYEISKERLALTARQPREYYIADPPTGNRTSSNSASNQSESVQESQLVTNPLGCRSTRP
ncbi:MAG: hypothetical protein AB7V46_12140 [Thermomicrobiales bacterium]